MTTESKPTIHEFPKLQNWEVQYFPRGFSRLQTVFVTANSMEIHNDPERIEFKRGGDLVAVYPGRLFSWKADPR